MAANIGVLMFRRVAGRPLLPRIDLAAQQQRRTMSRCQRRMVSGVTSSRSPWRRAFGITPSRIASSARSAQFSSGRHGCRLCSTASCWRKIKISMIRHASSRRDSRSHATTRVIKRKTNRRHMTGDHHGQTAGMATLLVRALDGLLGTHSSSTASSAARQPRRTRPALPSLSARASRAPEPCAWGRPAWSAPHPATGFGACRSVPPAQPPSRARSTSARAPDEPAPSAERP